MINLATFREALHGAPIVPVLTVNKVEHAAPLANVLLKGGLKSAEVTLRTPVALEVAPAALVQRRQCHQPSLRSKSMRGSTNTYIRSDRIPTKSPISPKMNKLPKTMG